MRPVKTFGERIADALSETGFFGHNFCWLLATGEERGEAEVALSSLAETYEREAVSRERAFGVFLAPAVVLALGFVILTVIVALYMPIFTLGDVIS